MSPERELYTPDTISKDTGLRRAYVSWEGQVDKALGLVKSETEGVVWVHRHGHGSRCVDPEGEPRGCIRVAGSDGACTVSSVPEEPSPSADTV